jgi:MFS family permease
MSKDSPWRNKTLLALCVGEALLMIGLGFLSPILPKFVLVLGVKPTQIGTMVGLAITAYGIARVIMDLPAGRLAQSWGRRPLLILGPAIVAISALGCGLAIQYWQLVTFRLLQGLGSAVFSVAAIVVIGEISTPSNRGQYMSFYWGSLLIGSSLGPTFGGFVGQYLGYRAPFFCFSGLALLATLWNYLRIPETKKRASPSAQVSQSLEQGERKGSLVSGNLSTPDSTGKQMPLYKNLSFMLICAVSLFTLISLSGNQITLVPLLGYERLGLTESQVGLTLSLVAAMQFVFVFLAGRLSDKLGRKVIIVPGGIITALGLVLFIQGSSYWFFLASAVVLGIGRGFGGAVPTAYVADIASPQNYENTMALYRTVSDIGFVVGPILLGWLKDTSGLNFPFFLGAGLLLTVVICFGALARETVGHSKGY